MAKTPKLNLNQRQFINFYTIPGTDTFCNGTLSYAEAYDFDLEIGDNGKPKIGTNNYNTCCSNAYKLIRNPLVKKEIEDAFNKLLNDKSVDSRLSQIVFSSSDANSLNGIKIYNDLKQRVTKKLDVTSQGRPLVGLSDEELAAMLEE